MQLFSAIKLQPIPTALSLLVIASAVLLTACKSEVNIAIDEEGAGQMEVVVAASNTIMSLMGMAGDDSISEYIDSVLDEVDLGEFDDSIIEPYSQSGYTGVRIKVDFDAYDPTITALSEDDSILGELAGAIGIFNLKLERTAADDGWIIEFKPPDVSQFTDSMDGILGDDTPDLGAVDLPYTLSITLPGEYVEHNADREVNESLVWDGDILEGIEVRVVSRDPGIQIQWVPIIITAIFALIFITIVVSVIVSRERRRRREESDAAAELAESSAEGNV